jgi:hypothetical protein
MPWYEYVCTKCGRKAKRNRSIAYRDALAVHNEDGGCGDGVLKRASALPGRSQPSLDADARSRRRGRTAARESDERDGER